MYCPQCGERNPPGSKRCSQCKYPFTRQAVLEQGPPARRPAKVRSNPGPPPPEPISKSNHGRRGCIALLIVAVVILAALAIGALLVNNRVIRPAISNRIESDLIAGVETAIDNTLPEADDELPAQEIVVTEAEINQGIIEYGDLGPVDGVSIDIRPGEIVVSLSAYGLNDVYTTGMRVENGQIVLDGGSLDGPLGFFVSAGELEQIVNDTLAASLDERGYRVNAVAIRDGEVAFSVDR